MPVCGCIRAALTRRGGLLQQQAEQYKFIIVAPDSRSDNSNGWSVASAKMPPTPDMLHTQVEFEY